MEERLKNCEIESSSESESALSSDSDDSQKPTRQKGGNFD